MVRYVLNTELIEQTRLEFHYSKKQAAEELETSSKTYGRWVSHGFRDSQKGVPLHKPDSAKLINNLVQKWGIPKSELLIEEPWFEPSNKLVGVAQVDIAEMGGLPGREIPRPVNGFVAPADAISYLALCGRENSLTVAVGMDFSESLGFDLRQRLVHALGGEKTQGEVFLLADEFLHKQRQAGLNEFEQKCLLLDVIGRQRVLCQRDFQSPGPDSLIADLGRLPVNNYYNGTWDRVLYEYLTYALPSQKIRLIDYQRWRKPVQAKSDERFVFDLLGSDLSPHTIVSGSESTHLTKLNEPICQQLACDLMSNKALVCVGFSRIQISYLRSLLGKFIKKSKHGSVFVLGKDVPFEFAYGLFINEQIRTVGLSKLNGDWDLACQQFFKELKCKIDLLDADGSSKKTEPALASDSEHKQEQPRHYRAAPVASKTVELPELPLSQLPPPRHRFVEGVFVERSLTTKQIVASIKNRYKTGITGLHGIGGAGKTYMALRVSLDLKKQGWDVVWVSLLQQNTSESVPDSIPSSVSLNEALAMLAQAFQFDLKDDMSRFERMQTIERLYEKVSQQRPETVVVLDNAEGFEDLSLLLEPLKPVPVLVTSRTADCKHIINYQYLHKLTTAESEELCESLMEHVDASVSRRELTEQDLTDRRALCEALGGHPLAIRMAMTAFIRGSGESWSRERPFRKILRKLTEDMDFFGFDPTILGRAGESLHSTVYRTFYWLFGSLEETDGQIGLAARILLPLIAVVSRAEASLDTVKAAVNELSKLVQKELSQRGIKPQALRSTPPRALPKPERGPAMVTVRRATPYEMQKLADSQKAEPDPELHINVRRSSQAKIIPVVQPSRPPRTLSATSTNGVPKPSQGLTPPPSFMPVPDRDAKSQALFDKFLGIGRKPIKVNIEMLPDHPTVKTDKNYFLKLLRGAVSIFAPEKWRIIQTFSQFSEYQIRSLIQIFEEEVRKFAELIYSHENPRFGVSILQLKTKALNDWRAMERFWRSLPYEVRKSPQKTSLAMSEKLGFPKASDPAWVSDKVPLLNQHLSRSNVPGAELKSSRDKELSPGALRWLSALEMLKDPETFNTVKDKLQKLSLIEEGNTKDSVGIHPLIREFAFEERRRAKPVGDTLAVDGPSQRAVYQAGLTVLAESKNFEWSSFLDLIPRACNHEVLMGMVVNHALALAEKFQYQKNGWSKSAKILESALEYLVNVAPPSLTAPLKAELGELYHRMERPGSLAMLADGLRGLRSSEKRSSRRRACWKEAYLRDVKAEAVEHIDEFSDRENLEYLRGLPTPASWAFPDTDTFDRLRVEGSLSEQFNTILLLGFTSTRSQFLSNLVHDIECLLHWLIDRHRLTKNLLKQCQALFDKALAKHGQGGGYRYEISPGSESNTRLALLKGEVWLESLAGVEVERRFQDLKQLFIETGIEGFNCELEFQRALWLVYMESENWAAARRAVRHALEVRKQRNQTVHNKPQETVFANMTELRLLDWFAQAIELDPESETDLEAELQAIEQSVKAFAQRPLLPLVSMAQSLLYATRGQAENALSAWRQATSTAQSQDRNLPRYAKIIQNAIKSRASLTLRRLNSKSAKVEIPSLRTWCLDSTKLPKRVRSRSDGRPMRLIPGGFQRDLKGQEVWLYPFYIDEDCVSAADFSKVCKRRGSGSRSQKGAIVTAADAEKFVTQTGKRLPTSYEWFAATAYLSAGQVPIHGLSQAQWVELAFTRIDAAIHGSPEIHKEVLHSSPSSSEEFLTEWLQKQIIESSQLRKAILTAIKPFWKSAKSKSRFNAKELTAMLKLVLESQSLTYHEMLETLVNLPKLSKSSVVELKNRLQRVKTRMKQLNERSRFELLNLQLENYAGLLEALNIKVEDQSLVYTTNELDTVWSEPSTRAKRCLDPAPAKSVLLRGNPFSDPLWYGGLMTAPSFCLAGLRCTLPMFSQSDLELVEAVGSRSKKTKSS